MSCRRGASIAAAHLLDQRSSTPVLNRSNTPVPETDDDVLKEALIQYAIQARAKKEIPFDLKGYSQMSSGSLAVNGTDLLKNKQLLQALVQTQPAARYLATQLISVISGIMQDNADWGINTSTCIPDKQWAKMLSGHIVLLLSHWRRITMGRHADL